jgi:hypothetical protein
MNKSLTLKNGLYEFMTSDGLKLGRLVFFAFLIIAIILIIYVMSFIYSRFKQLDVEKLQTRASCFTDCLTFLRLVNLKKVFKLNETAKYKKAKKEKRSSFLNASFSQFESKTNESHQESQVFELKAELYIIQISFF